MTDFISWDEVQASPDYQKLPPEKKEAARDSYFKQAVAPKVSAEKLTAARQSFDRYSMKSAPAEQKSLMGKIGTMLGDENPAVGVMETGALMATGMAALPFEAAASLTAAATAPAGLRARRAAGASQAVGDALTYEPRSTAGKQLTKAASTVLGIPGTVGDYAQEAVGGALENKGIPGLSKAAQITARMAPEVAAAVLGGRAGEAVEGRAATALSATRAATTEAASAALNTAKDLVSKAGLKWEDVPPEMQKKLRIAARDPKGLEKLDPETVQREVRAARLGMPITRGDAARNLGQQTREDTIKKTGDENPIRDIRSAQDTALHGAVDKVRKSTGAEATTHEQVGESVQDAGIRDKKAASKSAYDAAFHKARKTEPHATVSADPFFEALEHNPAVQHLDFVKTWLKKAGVEQEVEGVGAAPKPKAGRSLKLSTDVSGALKARAAKAGKSGKAGAPETTIERRPLSLSELQDLRETASDIARSAQGSEKHFASMVVRSIDKSFEKIPPAAKAWKEARSLYKAHQEEFEEQGIIKALGSDKRNSSDPRVDKEKTVDKVLRSSKADIGRLKKTLTSGGTKATRVAGEKAWRNIQAGVLDTLKQKAEGPRGIKGEKGQAQFGSQFLVKFKELEANGKIDAIFDAKQAAKLREIAKGVEDVRTKADKGISGADTAANLKAQNTLSKLEHAAKIPYVGKYIAGVAKVAGHVMKAGQTEAEFAHAKTTPVTEAAQKARDSRKKAAKERRGTGNTLKTLRRGASTSALTLQNQDQSQQK